MKLSVIVPSLDGRIPQSVREQIKDHPEVEVVSVVGIRPVGRARNEGLDRAAGEYVAWVDSDDEVSEDWLEQILLELSRNPQPDVLLFDLHTIGWLGMGDLIYGGESEKILDAVYANENVQGHLVRVVSRRSLWDGLAFDEQLLAMEDFLLLPKVIARAKSMIYLPRMLYNYIRTEDSAISSVNPARAAESMRVHIRRFGETPEEFRTPSLTGCMHGIYIGLQLFHVDRIYRKLALDPATERVVRGFLIRHLFRVRCSAHERLRYFCAAVGFWYPQRLARWWHFGRKGL